MTDPHGLDRRIALSVGVAAGAAHLEVARDLDDTLAVDDELAGDRQHSVAQRFDLQSPAIGPP